MFHHRGGVTRDVCRVPRRRPATPRGDRRGTEDLTSTVRPGSGLKVGWICGLGHRYKATVDARSGRGQGCPVCAHLRCSRATTTSARPIRR
ncbi:zinc-ribbon domain-containing protein [Georgenia sp. SUBG003]|uniref:zinc-ribbon domain-containing protein n=1 Tax=Georgenia sp. SUBG003 TaxID=1497974 RepID=UPI003AB89C4B